MSMNLEVKVFKLLHKFIPEGYSTNIMETCSISMDNAAPET